MKKIGFFTLALVFLASGLIFLGCDSELPGNGNGGGGGMPVAAVLTFWGEDSQNRDVRIRITTPPERLPGPSTGDAFNITVFNQGDAEDETFTGTITVSGTDPIAITFNQTAPTAGSTFSGSFARETGTMTTTGTIPGTTISGITAQLGGIEPPGGGGGGGGGGGTGGGGGGVPVNQGTLFTALPHVINVEFDNSLLGNNRLTIPANTLGAVSGQIFEGQTVVINTPRFLVTFSDGTVAHRNSNFIIYPPIFEAGPGGGPNESRDYYIIYTGSAGICPNIPGSRFVKSNTGINPSNRALNNATFTRLWDPIIDGPLPTFIGWSLTNAINEPITAHTTRLNIFEDDISFAAIASNRNLRARLQNGVTFQLPITSNHPMRVRASTGPELLGDGFSYRIVVYIGSQEAVIPLQEYDVFRIFGINYTAPARTFILFDDPRFVGNHLTDAPVHYLNLFRAGDVIVTYRNAAGRNETRRTNIPALYRLAWQVRERGDPIAPSVITSADYPLLQFIRPAGNITNPMVSLRYTGENNINTASQSLNVPMYNNLVRITVESLVGLIEMNGALSPQDGPDQFLQRVRIDAVYQLGNDRNNWVRRENVLRDMRHPALGLPAAPLGFEYSLDLPPAAIGTDVASALTLENSNAFARNGRLARVFVWLTPPGGLSAGIMQQARIDIGVRNFF